MAKILLIDDDQMESELLSMRLRDEGHDVQVVEDGLSAAKAAQKYLPDIIFLDFNLPGACGPDVLKELRAAGATKAIPVVMATSMSRDHVFAAVGKDADVGYLQKPLDLKKMLEFVAKTGKK